MTTSAAKANVLGRFWQLVLETSEAAVAVHYDAPWGAPWGDQHARASSASRDDHASAGPDRSNPCAAPAR